MTRNQLFDLSEASFHLLSSLQALLGLQLRRRTWKSTSPWARGSPKSSGPRSYANFAQNVLTDGENEAKQLEIHSKTRRSQRFSISKALKLG